MAFLLRFDGVNDYVALPSLVGGEFADRLDVNQEWTLEWQFKRSGSDTYIHRFFDNIGGSEGVLYRASDGLLRMTLLSGGPGDWTGVSTNSTDPATFRIVKTGGLNQYELFVDDGTGSGFVSYGTRSTSVQIFRFDVIGREGTTGYINGDLYYVDYSTTNSGANYFCDPSASNGTGSILPDTVGSNDGTLVNFPTDNSQWVFYSDATGVTADVAYTVNSPSVSASASATIPATHADVAFTVSPPNLAVSASASLPNPIANANVTVNIPTVAASVNATQPATQGNWYLNFQTDGYIQFSPLVSDIGVDYSWDIEFRATNNTSEEFIVLGEDGDVENFLIIRNDNTIDYKVDSSQKAFAITDKSDESAVYRFEARGGSISLYENNILKGTQSFPNVKVGGTLDSGFSRIGNARGDITRKGALYYLKYTDNNNPNNNRFFNPSSSGGAGTTLSDDDSGLNGSQVGAWPSDNSEWVSYQDTASADIAFSVNVPTVTGNASATLPIYSAEVSFTVSSPSVSANASATLPNPSVDIGYTVSAPTINASAGATLPNPVSDIAFSVSVPSVSASATVTEPNFNANVAFTVNTPTVSISARATLPQPESTVNFTISPPSVSVVAIVGGIAIIVDEETNINQRVLSNNINAPILSNNINAPILSNNING